MLDPVWLVAAAQMLRSRRKKPLPADIEVQPLTDEDIRLIRAFSRPPGIFLCYRRQDTQGFARSIYDRLERKYGSQNVFRDVDSVPAGVRFPDWIQQKLSLSKIMIVLIGSEWLEILDEHKRRRLDLTDDWVRQEIHMALLSGIPIIPVLLQGARMPSKNELPSSIDKLADFQFAEVTDRRWDYDMGELIKGIDYLMSLH